MPFESKAQMKAAFGGYLGPEMKAKAKHWADVTPDPKHLPEHVTKKASFWNGFIDELSKYADAMPGMPEQVSAVKMAPSLGKAPEVSSTVIQNSIPKPYKPHIPAVKSTQHATTPLVKFMGKNASLLTTVGKGALNLVKKYPLASLGTAATVGVGAYTVAKDTSNFNKGEQQ